jgi:hypothetical protein
MDRKPVSFSSYWLNLVLLLVFIGFLPDFLITLAAPDELVYSGALINTDDISAYISAIRQGAQGEWMFSPQFSPEQVPSHIAYLPFILVGKLQALLGGSLLLWYQILRAISVITAGFALKSLIETIYPNRSRHQKTAGILLLFGSGIGWFVSILSGTTSLMTPDLYVPEWNMVTGFFSSPHFILGIAAQAWFFSSILKGIEEPAANNIVEGLLAAVLIGATYPFLAPVNGLILALFYLGKVVKTRQVPWKMIGVTVLQSFPLLMCLWYYGIMLPKDVQWARAMVGNNVIEPPLLAGILVGFGIISLLGLLSVFDKKEALENEQMMLISWLVGNLVSLYLPVSFAGRLVLGLFLPIGLLAADGLENALLPRYVNPQKGVLRRIIVGLTLPSTILLMVWSLLSGLSIQNYPYYFPHTEIDAASFLAEKTTPEDIVLADYPIGNYLPRLSEARVFAGHLNLTIDLDDKLALMNTFWNPSTSDEWRESFLQEWGITYLYQGAFENSRFEGSINIPGAVIYEEDGIMIYKID